MRSASLGQNQSDRAAPTGIAMGGQTMLRPRPKHLTVPLHIMIL